MCKAGMCSKTILLLLAISPFLPWSEPPISILLLTASVSSEVTISCYVLCCIPSLWSQAGLLCFVVDLSVGSGAAVGQQTALLRLVHEPLVFSVYYGEQRTSVGPGMERRSLKANTLDKYFRSRNRQNGDCARREKNLLSAIVSPDKADQKKHHVDKRKKLLRDYCLGDGNNIPGKRHNNSPIGFRANLPKKQPLIDREKKPHLDYFWDAKNIVPRGSRHCSDIGFDSDPEFGTGDSDDELDDGCDINLHRSCGSGFMRIKKPNVAGVPEL
ncbi:uncharacterized protein LOC141724434 isoform X2 [Apium graveolens]|uniref:uncharacterized protein LOC141724434 isoform X2 n=1 Tax=Apium graveolens TaxID=4045 RepID=UPI003D7B4A55